MTDDVLLQYIKETKKFSLLTAKEEANLSKLAKKGDPVAIEKLVNSNLRLVIKMAKQYSNDDSQIMDLIQEGNIGLLKAAKKFDASFKVKFSSYAAWWIKQSFGRYLNSNKRMIKLPTRKEELLRLAEKETRKYESVFGKEPSHNELAKLCDKKYEEILEVKQLQNYDVYSLDMPICNQNSTMYDLLPSYDYNPEKQFIDNEFKENVKKCLELLNEREQDVVKKRYCLDGARRAISFKLLGKKYSISAESVRQTQLRAIRKLQEKKSVIEALV